MTHPRLDTAWRATGPYVAVNASKTGLLDETQQFLRLYAQRDDLAAVRRQLVDGGLPQRARATRQTIVEVISRRLTAWQPPSWVLADLASFANAPNLDSLKAALLLHGARQDQLLYDVVQRVIVPGWLEGQREISRGQVQRFLDQAQPTHPEIDGWSRETREKLAGNLLSILRDDGLLSGRATKTIVEPIVPPEVAAHLVHLLSAEGVAPGELTAHPDWRLWLWDCERVARVLSTLPNSLEVVRA